jgi:hypothetical protein
VLVITEISVVLRASIWVLVKPLSEVAVRAENWVAVRDETWVDVSSSISVVVSAANSVAVRSLAQSSERIDTNESLADTLALSSPDNELVLEIALYESIDRSAIGSAPS